MTHKAVFLDQDGTLVQTNPYNFQISSTELNDDVVEGLQRLQSYGYLLIVVSNKSGLEEIKGSLYDSCAHLGIYLDGFYPFWDEQHIIRASEDLKIDLHNSWVVGGSSDDAGVVNKAGCKSIRINNGNEARQANGHDHLPAYSVHDLAEASKYIVAADNMNTESVKVEHEKVYAYSSATPNQ